jgi:hypothetical protein
MVSTSFLIPGFGVFGREQENFSLQELVETLVKLACVIPL